MKYDLTIKEDGTKLVRLKARTLNDIVKKLNEKCNLNLSKIKNTLK